MRAFLNKQRDKNDKYPILEVRKWMKRRILSQIKVQGPKLQENISSIDVTSRSNMGLVSHTTRRVLQHMRQCRKTVGDG